MNTSTTVVQPVSGTSKAAQQQIRGSSLLLFGRVLSMGLNFTVQILIARYLAKSDYGSFTYVLSIVAVCQTVATFGLDRAVTRFIPIYHEQEDYPRLFGTLIMVLATILGLSTLMLVLVYTLNSEISQNLLNDAAESAQLTARLLVILIVLAPIQALDDLIAALFAIFASPRSIFFRKFILAPLLKLGVVLLLMVSGSGILFFASGYLVAEIIGLVTYLILLVHVFRKMEFVRSFRWSNVTVPFRTILAFTIPLLTSDLVFVVMNSSDAVMLGYFHNAAEVAAFRAVQPTAILNQVVLTSFTLLFTPTAARLFARKDYAGINSMYWQTAVWTAILSFPIFVLTFSLSPSITFLLYGDRYLSSAPILALLSLGYYFNAALGFNGLTLKIFGRLKYIMVINVLATIINFCLNLLLIPRYGAIGAAVGTTASLIIHNLLKQFGLRLGTGINLFDWQYLKIYLSIVAGTLFVLGLGVVLPNVYLGLAGALLTAIVVVMMNRRALNIEQTFPELLRVPLIRKLLG